MLFSMMRAILIIVFLAGAAVVLLGWWGIERFRSSTEPGTSTAPSHEPDDRARRIGAKVGERAGEAAGTAGQALASGTLTAKIKAKLALDDTVRARDIDVDTTGSTVTVSGTVRSAAERDRVLQLARETDGVTEVVDRIRVAP